MPSEQTVRELKLVQYLVETHGKEKELESALQAHIKVAKKATYKKRLQEHLRETKAQSKAIERRIKALGGTPDGLKLAEPVVDAVAVGNAAINKGAALAKGVGHAIRGTSDTEQQLKNAKTELFNEHEEIANYLALETVAETLNDKETAKLARDHRKQEERMAAFLQKVIPQLAKDVIREEIPARDRRAPSTNGAGRSSTSRSNGRTSTARKPAASTGRAKSTGTRAKAAGSSRSTRSTSSRSSTSSRARTRTKGS